MSTNMEHVFRIGKQSSVLPAGYTQLEYIESTGTQYIDIPFTFNNTDEMRAEVAITDTVYTDRYFIAPTSWNTNNNRFALGGFHTNPTQGFNYAYGSALTGNTQYVSGTDHDFHAYHYINKTFSMVDLGIVKDVSAISWGGETTNLRLFYSYAYPIKCKIKNIWHKRNNKYLYNYIPAKRNSDNVLGMYDTVSGRFFTNTGTGVFTAGPAVEVCKISQSNQTIWERAILLESDKDSEVTFRSTRNNEYSPLKELNAYGELTLNGVPSGYTELEYIEGTGAQYMVLGNNVYLQTGSIIEVDYQITADNPNQPEGLHAIYGNGLNSTVFPRGLFSFYTSIRIKRDVFMYDSFNNGPYDSKIDTTRHVIRQESEKFYKDGKLIYTSPISDFTNNTPVLLFSRYNATNLYMIGKMYSAKIWSDGTNLSFNGIPAKRNSDGVLGMYDTVSGTFLTNAGTGDFVAGPEVVPTPSDPVDLICNNGTINGAYSELEYIESTGTQYIDTGITHTDANKFVIDIKFKSSNSRCLLGFSTVQGDYFGKDASDNYELGGGISMSPPPYVTDRHVVTFDRSGSKGVLSVEGKTIERAKSLPEAGTFKTMLEQQFSGNGIVLYKLIAYYNNDIVGNFIPARNSSGVIGMYDTVSNTFFTNQGTGTFTAGNIIRNYIAVGTVEKLTDNVGNSALCKPLLKIGDYADTQEILTGLINHQVGIYVFDGTETWLCAADMYIHQNSCDALVNLYSKGLYATDALNADGFCSHLRLENDYIWAEDHPNTFTFHSSGDTYRQCHFNFAHSVIGTSSSSTRSEVEAAIKAYVAAQYAAGTPVILVYPLATSTTESVAAQDIEINKGTYTAKVEEASLNDLDISVKYLGND